MFFFQNFSELIEAASKGNQRGVDQFNVDLLTTAGSAEGDESMYAKFTEEIQESPQLVFCFGKAVGSEIGISVIYKLNLLITYRLLCLLRFEITTLHLTVVHLWSMRYDDLVARLSGLCKFLTCTHANISPSL